MRTQLLIAGLGLAALAAGCGSSSSGSPSASGSASVIPTPTPTHHHHHSASPAPTVTVSVTPTPTPTVTVTKTAAPGVSRCLSSNLKLSFGVGQGTAGSTYQAIVFTNEGTSACELHGYPGLSFDDAAGTIVGEPAAEDPGKIKTITLAAAGGQANALLRLPDVGNFPASSCHKATSTQIRIYPPGEKVSLFLAGKNTVCTTAAGRTGIGPMLAGNGG